MGNRFVCRLAKHLARLQAATGAGNDFIAAHERIATARRKHAEVAHYLDGE